MRERRSAQRYRLSLPIVVDLLTPLRIEWQKGMTKDISVQGVYFLTDQEPAPDSVIELKISVPSKSAAVETVLQARGKVVRVERVQEQGVGGVGVAAALERCDIVRNKLRREDRVSSSPIR